MRNFARGRLALSFLVLVVGITYFQPRVGEAFNIASDSQTAIIQDYEKVSNIESRIIRFSNRLEAVASRIDNLTDDKKAAYNN